MMSTTITATELKSNLGTYLDRATEEDILIFKNGKAVAVLTKPKEEMLFKLGKHRGKAKYTYGDYKEELAKGLSEKYESTN